MTADRLSISSVMLLSVALFVSAATARAQSNTETQPATAPTTQPESNPPADRFNLEASDPRAIEIADAVMETMGGREAWDETRYITWNFFGARSHVWDKHTGEIRIEYDDRETNQPATIAMNIETREGRAWRAGAEVTDESKLSGLLQRGYEMWVNDSYWLVMPYKLKDSGVTLKYIGERAMQDGRDAHVLELTFEDVGVTPQNKYEIFVAQDTGLVEQWAFFAKADDVEPAFITPWHNWQQFGEIMLSDDRGELRGREAKMLDIAVFDELPRSISEPPRGSHEPGSVLTQPTRE